MRLLIATPPITGYVLPIVPLGWAARDAGHEVVVATTGAGIRQAVEAGLPAYDVAPGVDLGATMKALMARVREARRAGEKIEGPPPGGGSMFSTFNDEMADRTVELARGWWADAIVFTRTHLAGRLAADVLGIPSVETSPGLPVTAETMGMDFLLLPETCERHGRTRELAPAAGLLDPCPPSLRPAEMKGGWPIRYVPYNGGGELPEWLAAPPERSRVCVTLGTVVPGMGGDRIVPDLVAAAGELDAEVVLALGDTDLGDLPLPPNVRRVGWTPLSVLLPSCAAVVHHGGSGTTWASLALGVPQLLIPQGADQPVNAAAVQARGAGISLEGAVDRDAVTEALPRLLRDEGIRAAASEVREEIAAMPSPARVMGALPERLAR